MAAIQLDFWKSEEECEFDAMRLEMKQIRESGEKVRRALFARNGELTKRVLELEERLHILERNICRGKYDLH